MPVLYFFVLAFFISQQKCSGVYSQKQQENPTSKDGAQRVAHTRVTHHIAGHPWMEVVQSLTPDICDMHLDCSHVGHKYSTLSLWRWVRKSLLRAIYNEKLVFIWPISVTSRSFIIVTKIVAVILSMASCPCCGGNVNHTVLPFSPFPFLLASFGSEAVTSAIKLIHSNTGCCRDWIYFLPFPALHQAENTSGQLPLKFLPNMSLICVVHDISPQLELTCEHLAYL